MSFTVYRSSAGSGKTYTLVKEYLGIVLRNPRDFRSILAITFTNKAANEMRDRIISSLREIAEPENYQQSVAVQYMLPELQESVGLENQQLSANAGIVLGLILHDYQDFSVSTIDSFIHRIIRTFAFDLHLPLNFEVEVDEKNMVTMAVDLLLSRVGVDKVPTNILKKYTESRISDEKNWDIEKDLKKFSRRLLRDDIAEFLPALKSMKTETILAISDILSKSVALFEKETSSKAEKLKSIWDANDITVSDLYYGKNGIFGYIRRLALNDYSKLKANSKVEITLGEDKWCSPKVDSDKEALINDLKGEMLEITSDLINYIEGEIQQYTLYKLLKRNIFPLAVLNEIESVLVQIRESEGIIHISEFDKRISEVVNHEPIPFIYERLGERYKHFLVDEFQDTSILEWQNILPLIENTLAEAHFNMIVGDAKQAIYRFKGGEVEQLVRLPEIYKRPDTADMESREKQLIRNYRPDKLNKNFRSRREIIGFNNDFYSFIASRLPESIKEIYADCKQELPADKPGGEVRINFVDIEGNKDIKEPVYLEQIRLFVAEMTEEKGYSYSDIAILCRSNNDASRIARNLLLNGIDVISAESLLLSSSPEVNFLVFCLDYITNQDDKIALAGLIAYLNRRDGDGNLHELLEKCLPGKVSHENAEAKTGFIDYLRTRGIAFSPDELNQMGLYERIEALIRSFALDSSPDPYILFFLDVVFDFSRNKRFVPEDFASYWRDNSKNFSIVVPEGMDAVNVMTIHKAKGLEFPVVIYPFANSEINISKDQKWINIDNPGLPGLKSVLLPLTAELKNTEYANIHEEETEKAVLDMLNILYVATTRPTERLLIICNKPSSSGNELKSIPSMIRVFLEHKEMLREGENEYSFGDTGMLARKESEKEENLKPEEFITGDWRQNIMLSGHVAEYWDLEDDARNLEWGNLVHGILARINTISDLDPVISSEICQGRLSEEEANDLKAILMNIMGKEETKAFFDGSYKIRNEVGIMKSGGKEYRPDRLMIQDNKAIVLDYKTGKEDPAHLRQIESYGTLLTDMGFAEVEKYLLYIDKEYKLIQV